VPYEDKKSDNRGKMSMKKSHRAAGERVKFKGEMDVKHRMSKKALHRPDLD